MKKLIVALILAGGVTVMAFAALESSPSASKDVKSEKKKDMKKKRKECSHTCMYSI